MPTNPKAVAGRFVGMLSRRVIPFMFNPTTVEIQHGWTHGEHQPFGRSHPLYGGGTGNAEIITFTLDLDGDRGRSNTRPSFAMAAQGFRPTFPADPIDVMPEINRLRSTVLPYDADRGVAYGVPETFFLTLGASIRAEVAIQSVGTQLTAFLPDLSVLRGNVSIACHVEHMANQTSWSFSQREQNNRHTRWREDDA